MKIKLIALAIITLLAQSICAQNIFKAIVKEILKRYWLA